MSPLFYCSQGRVNLEEGQIFTLDFIADCGHRKHFGKAYEITIYN